MRRFLFFLFSLILSIQSLNSSVKNILFPSETVYKNTLEGQTSIDHIHTYNLTHFFQENKFFIVFSTVFIFALLLLLLLFIQKNIALNNIRKKAAQSLQYFKTLFQASSNMIIVSNQSRIIHANRRFLSFFDCDTIDDFYKRYDSLLNTFQMIDDNDYIDPKSDAGIWMERIFFSSKNNFKVAINGSHFLLSVHSVSDNHQYMVTFNDISHVVTQKNRLEGEVFSATHTIIEQQKLLKSQSQKAAMGEMISIIAHQLKQPLAAISAMTTNIKIKNELAVLDLDFCLQINDKIAQDVGFMSTTIDDFRNFFKPNKASFCFNIKDTVDEVITLLEPLLNKYNIRIQHHSHGIIIVKSFPSELKQVIMNIVNNAKDIFLEKEIKSPLITIDSTTEKGNCILSISDNAGGIPEKILPNIFTPYFSTKGSKGTGLGLHMTKMIIEDSLKGTIHAYNNKNGAVFEIIFPLEVKKEDFILAKV